jgi:hypothetical protein
MLGGVLAWGGIGYLVDRLIGLERYVFTAIGFVVGAVGATYLVYMRFGKGKGTDG